MVIGTALALAGAAASAAQAVGGFIQKKRAQEAAEQSAERYRALVNTDIVNRYSGVMAQTRGHERALDRVAQSAAMATEATKQAGAAGVIGGTTNIVDAAGEQAAKIGDAQLRD
jgi:hypothetical protein